MKECRLKNILRRIYWKLDEYYTEFVVKYAPINHNKIVFDNFCGRGYGENPKYIAEEIHRNGLEWDMVWLVGHIDIDVPPYLRKVVYGAQQAKRELSTAKVVVRNVRNDLRTPKKRRQLFLQTWHGGIGFKDVEGSAESKLDASYVASARLDGAECDAIISACAYQTEEYRKYFWLSENTEILEVGQPRCDALFVDDKNRVSKKVREKLNIGEDCGIILYAPTFRDDHSTDGYQLDFNGILDAFTQKYGKEYVIIVRLHPNAQKLCGFMKYDNQIISGTEYPDIQELYIASDVLITDYSSTAFDFALLRKPVFMCALDYEQYILLRGLNDVYEHCPFVKTYTNETLIQSILDFDEDEYFSKFEKFVSYYWCPFDDGKAAERIVGWLKTRMKKSKGIRE